MTTPTFEQFVDFVRDFTGVARKEKDRAIHSLRSRPWNYWGTMARIYWRQRRKYSV